MSNGYDMKFLNAGWPQPQIGVPLGTKQKALRQRDLGASKTRCLSKRPPFEVLLLKYHLV